MQYRQNTNSLKYKMWFNHFEPIKQTQTTDSIWSSEESDNETSYKYNASTELWTSDGGVFVTSKNLNFDWRLQISIMNRPIILVTIILQNHTCFKKLYKIWLQRNIHTVRSGSSYSWKSRIDHFSHVFESFCFVGRI